MQRRVRELLRRRKRRGNGRRMSPTVKCARCPASVEPGEDLCCACSIELVHRILAAEPTPNRCHCAVCGAPFSYVDARVLRFVKDPSAKLSHETPLLCWVCARLHYAAAQDDPLPTLGW